jgi:hypothetical protein
MKIEILHVLKRNNGHGIRNKYHMVKKKFSNEGTEE